MSMTEEELIEKKEELLKRLTAIRADLGKGLEADSKEQAIQLENLDVLREIARVTEIDLGKITLQLFELKRNASLK